MQASNPLNIFEKNLFPSSNDHPILFEDIYVKD
jgi:hypothetical protein